jgi:hypothetical protein
MPVMGQFLSWRDSLAGLITSHPPATHWILNQTPNVFDTASRAV